LALIDEEIDEALYLVGELGVGQARAVWNGLKPRHPSI
jgi:hypothetical protein